MSERIMNRPLDPKADDEWDRIFRKGKYAPKEGQTEGAGEVNPPDAYWASLLERLVDG